MQHIKKLLLSASLTAAALTATAQGGNVGLGGNDGNYQSLAERVLKLEKKNNIFNAYLNFSAAGRAREYSGEWKSGFTARQLRLEIKGDITEKLHYRFRQRFNKSTDAESADNSASATDILMVAYDVVPQFTIMGGKMCAHYGGFEFDENPVYVYQLSDMVNTMDNFHVGIALSFKPVPSQEFIAEVQNVTNSKLSEYYGEGAKAVEGSLDNLTTLEESKTQLTYILNWNGNFFDKKIQTRWSWGLRHQAKNTWSRIWVFGQQLNFNKLQWYFDYMGSWDGYDRLKIANSELKTLTSAKNPVFTKVHYNSFITQLKWQFYDNWNIEMKGIYETASVNGVEKLKRYRKAKTFVGSIEYFPVKGQDFKVFLAYIGKNFRYTEESELNNYSTNRIEIGMQYRLKIY